MKRILFILFLLVGVAAFAQYQRRALFHFVVNNSSTTVPVSLTTNLSYWANCITFKGLKAVRVNNAGDVYIGVASGDDTQHIVVSPGGEVVYRCPPNEQVNLANFFLDVTVANDGLSVSFE